MTEPTLSVVDCPLCGKPAPARTVATSLGYTRCVSCPCMNQGSVAAVDIQAKAKRLARKMRGRPTPIPDYVFLGDGLDGESDPVVMKRDPKTGEVTVEPWDGEEM